MLHCLGFWYPPGIPLLIPGECFNATIVRYLKFARDFNACFPGFETDIHGLVKAEGGGYYVDCVSQSTAEAVGTDEAAKRQVRRGKKATE